jgi:uncharacterized protein YdaU (DUF1376 family)
MSRSAPAFQLYAADFYMDTLTWETDDIGVYFCLLMAEWVNGPLENDTRKLAKIAKKTHQKFIKNWTKISQKFVETDTGMLVNLRLEEQREIQIKYSESQKERANKRWGKEHTGAYATALPAHMPEACSSSSSSSSNKDTNKRKSIKKEKLDEYVFVLPNFIPQDTWNRFVEMRNRIKKPMTPWAAHLVCLELQKIKTTHNHDPVEVLNQSTRLDYQDVYPLKGDNGNGNRGNTQTGKQQAITNAAKSDGQPYPPDREF